MPKIKHTTRKEPERPALAVKELDCSYCGYKFNKSYNYRRHLSVTHGVDEHGQPTSAADRDRYMELARKEERKKSQKEPAPSTSSSTEVKNDESQ